MSVGVPAGLRDTGYVVADEDRAGGDRWRELIRVLYQYLRRDMRDAREQRERYYPRTHDNHIQKTVPLVFRIARELATLYVRPPAREYVGPTMTAAVQERIDGIMRDAQLDRTMRQAQEQLVVLAQSTVWVWPEPNGGGVRLLTPPPHDQAVELADPTSSSEADVSTWWLRLPVGQDALTGLTSYATAEVTASTAMWVDGPSNMKGHGVWAEDGSNPIGRIPVIRLKGSDPGPGEFWCPVPEDLVDAQRGINHMMTDLALVARMQGHGQPVVKGISNVAASEMELGPESIIGLSDTEGDFRFVQANPDLAGYQGVLDHYLRAVISTNGLNPATVIKSTAITALGKQLEILDREVERKRQVVEFQRGERAIYDMTRAWVNWLRNTELLPEARVEVTYRDHPMPADPLHEAQATKMMIDMGLSSPARELAKVAGMSLEEAVQAVSAIKAETAAQPMSGGTSSTLNGAQIMAALEIAARVATGLLTEDAGKTLLVEGLGMTPEAAASTVANAQPPPPDISLVGGA